MVAVRRNSVGAGGALQFLHQVSHISPMEVRAILLGFRQRAIGLFEPVDFPN